MSSPAPDWHVQVHGLCHWYGRRCAVDSASFALKRGETLGLLGPNGAGKSTTLLLLAGVLSPHAGSIVFSGGHMGAARRARIGLAPQATAFYRELSVDDNLRFFGGLYGLEGKRLRERVEWALGLVGLAARRDDRAGSLSGGMQRRLNLACAAVHEPELLLLDEPTAGVDAASRALLFESLEQLQLRGVTIVYSTHHLDEAERLCDRVAHFEHGSLVAIEAVERTSVSRELVDRRYLPDRSGAPSEAE
jgi:ABC-2 type transport system ATP-binding protein